MLPLRHYASPRHVSPHAIDIDAAAAYDLITPAIFHADDTLMAAIAVAFAYTEHTITPPRRHYCVTKAPLSVMSAIRVALYGALL